MRPTCTCINAVWYAQNLTLSLIMHVLVRTILLHGISKTCLTLLARNIWPTIISADTRKYAGPTVPLQHILFEVAQ